MKKITSNIYHVGDNGCSVFLVDTGIDKEFVLIDAGMSLDMIQQIESNGLTFSDIGHCILTHCHIDHIGICSELQQSLPHIKFYAHEADAAPIEKTGHDHQTAASWYGIQYSPIKLNQKFQGPKTHLQIGNIDFQCIHTPGHTPGSISVLVESEGQKVLFGQDIHGPFNTDFNSSLNDFQTSMETLLALNADILCEGHFGIFHGKDAVRQYIEYHKSKNLP